MYLGNNPYYLIGDILSIVIMILITGAIIKTILTKTNLKNIKQPKTRKNRLKQYTKIGAAPYLILKVLSIVM